MACGGAGMVLVRRVISVDFSDWGAWIGARSQVSIVSGRVSGALATAPLRLRLGTFGMSLGNDPSVR